jgi:hypothetical protein
MCVVVAQVDLHRGRRCADRRRTRRDIRRHRRAQTDAAGLETDRRRRLLEPRAVRNPPLSPPCSPLFLNTNSPTPQQHCPYNNPPRLYRRARVARKIPLLDLTHSIRDPNVRQLYHHVMRDPVPAPADAGVRERGRHAQPCVDA